MPVTNVVLDFPRNSKQPELFCPVCGANIQNSEGEVDHPACPHVEFCYIDDAGEFLYISQKMLNDLNQWEEADQDPLGAIQNNCPGETRIMISIVTNGVGCGPVSSMVVYGFNFLPEIG